MCNLAALAAMPAVLVEHHDLLFGRALLNVLFAALNGTVMRQASMQAYNDAWMLLLVCFVCVAPAVLLLRKPHARPAPGADAH